jgi:hypothetical protein
LKLSASRVCHRMSLRRRAFVLDRNERRNITAGQTAMA